MTLGRRLAFVLAFMGLLAACSSGGGGNNQPKPVTTFGHLRVINAIADSPSLTVKLGATSAGTVSFSQSTRLSTLGTSDYQFSVQYTTPGGSTQTVVPSRTLTITLDHEATVVLFGTLATPTVVLLDDANPAIAAGSSEVRFVQGSNAAGSIDFYLTDETVDISPTTIAPTATVNALEVSDLVTVPSSAASGADQRLRVTAAGDKTVLYDSGAFTLDDKARRLFLLADYFGPGGGVPAVRAVQIDEASASTFVAEDLPAALSVANLVVDGAHSAGLDGYLHGLPGVPDFAAVQVDTISTPPVAVGPGAVDLKLTTAGDTTVVHDALFAIGTGEAQTLVVAAGAAGDVTSRAVPDLVRPIAGQAQLRVVHASPASPSVDFFAIATTNPPSTPTAGKASLTALVLQASGTVALDADAAGTTTYDLYFTTAGTVTSVASVSGVAVAAGKAYSVFLADQIGGGQPARIVHPD